MEYQSRKLTVASYHMLKTFIFIWQICHNTTSDLTLKLSEYQI